VEIVAEAGMKQRLRRKPKEIQFEEAVVAAELAVAVAGALTVSSAGGWGKIVWV
jgi:nitrate reductase NapE component